MENKSRTIVVMSSTRRRERTCLPFGRSCMTHIDRPLAHEKEPRRCGQKIIPVLGAGGCVRRLNR